MPPNFKVLAVHGVGRHPVEGSWQDLWRTSLQSSLTRIDPNRGVEIDFVTYDDLFSAEEISAIGTMEALAKLVGSGVWHGVGDWFTGLFRRRSRGTRRSLSDIPERVRWTAGMVVQWVESSRLRRRTRARLKQAIDKHDPSIIVAHSLGSLVAYDTFIQPGHQELMSNRALITFGSQIGNPFVRSQFGGRVEPLNCRNWYHLFNPHDDVFTGPVRITAPNFEQVDATFDIRGIADHDAKCYLAHDNMSWVVWRDLVSTQRQRRRYTAARHSLKRRGDHKRRALLVGINEYPREEQRLEGCVNDVFLVSSLLQESGFNPSEIRTVLDDRATAAGIRERLEWLLDGAQPGDERVFFYSGHGSQLTDYGLDEIVDRKDECLVPWDFDWSREMAITDDYFFELYSQLPYDTRFLVLLDCCHSGGMTRAGVGKPRGLNPPDDIRHRELEWDPRRAMWKERRPKVANRTLKQDYIGEHRDTCRFGCAVDLRRLSKARYNRVRKEQRHHGPYLPIIVQACQESELAYEYRHGVTSYGAFTYSIAAELRRAGRRGISYANLVDRVTDILKNLGYDQTPNLVGPSDIVARPVPWGGQAT